jgi:hypothetical protein
MHAAAACLCILAGLQHLLIAPGALLVSLKATQLAGWHGDKAGVTWC